MSASPGLSNEASLQHGQSTQDSLATTNKPCFFCGGKTIYLRKNCSARNFICLKYQKKGHFARCCKSNYSLVKIMVSKSSLDNNPVQYSQHLLVYLMPLFHLLLI